MKLREEIAKALIEKSTVHLPSSIIEEEAAALRTERSEEANRLGLSMEDYLKRIQKTETEVEKSEREYIERQFKMRFILEAIAEKEKLSVKEEDIKAQTEILKSRYAEADPAHLHSYVKRLLLNEEVLRLLEGNKPEKNDPQA
jgi:trigger factor